MPIDRVGVKNLQLPVRVRSRDQQGAVQHTVAEVDLSVDLPAEFKGTHMSRFIEALQDWGEDLGYASFKNLLESVRTRLAARRAHILFRFPYFIQRRAPESGSPATMNYACMLQGECEGGRLAFMLGVDVPVMTVCPCSLAIQQRGGPQPAGPGAHPRALYRFFVAGRPHRHCRRVGLLAGVRPAQARRRAPRDRPRLRHPAFVEDVVRAARPTAWPTTRRSPGTAWWWRAWSPSTTTAPTPALKAGAMCEKIAPWAAFSGPAPAAREVRMSIRRAGCGGLGPGCLFHGPGRVRQQCGQHEHRGLRPLAGDS